MGDENEGDPQRFLQGLEFLLHALAQLQIQRAERLVEQQDFRLVDQRPGQSHALPLTSGQLSGAAGAVAAELDQFQRLFGFLLALGLGHFAQHQRIGDVIEHIEVREQRVILEYGIDVAPVGRHAGGVFAEDGDGA
ncbi:hypothetical protein D9M68_746430 [compost metagenome]